MKYDQPKKQGSDIGSQTGGVQSKNRESGSDLSMKPHNLIPPIPEKQQGPLVRQLLDIIDQQARLIEQ